MSAQDSGVGEEHVTIEDVGPDDNNDAVASAPPLAEATEPTEPKSKAQSTAEPYVVAGQVLFSISDSIRKFHVTDELLPPYYGFPQGIEYSEIYKTFAQKGVVAVSGDEKEFFLTEHARDPIVVVDYTRAPKTRAILSEQANMCISDGLPLYTNLSPFRNRKVDGVLNEVGVVPDYEEVRQNNGCILADHEHGIARIELKPYQHFTFYSGHCFVLPPGSQLAFEPDPEAEIRGLVIQCLTPLRNPYDARGVMLEVVKVGEAFKPRLNKRFKNERLYKKANRGLQFRIGNIGSAMQTITLLKSHYLGTLYASRGAPAAFRTKEFLGRDSISKVDNRLYELTKPLNHPNVLEEEQTLEEFTETLNLDVVL